MMSDLDKNRLQGQYDTPENARSENYGLTRKQIRFAEEYISTNDATHALLEAGYAPVQKVLDKMYQTYMRATEADDYTNANRSLENMGKHLGMFINKSEIKQSTTFQGVDETFTPNVEADIKRLADISGYSVIKGGKE